MNSFSLKKLPPDPHHSLNCLMEHLKSASGWMGGDLSNPIWFCALEGADDIKEGANPLQRLNESCFLGDPKPMPANMAKRHFYGGWNSEENSDGSFEKARPGGSAFFRTPVVIMGYLWNKDKTQRARDIFHKFEVFQKERLP